MPVQGGGEQGELVWQSGCSINTPHTPGYPGEKTWREPRCAVINVTRLERQKRGGEKRTPEYFVRVAQPCLRNIRNLSGAYLPSAARNFLGEFLAGATAGSLAPQPDGTYFVDLAGSVAYFLSPTQPQNGTVPRAEALVDASADAANVTWSGITFEHTTWLQPDTPTGYKPGTQNVV